MHKKYAKDGFVAISVSLDPPPEDPKDARAVQRYQDTVRNIEGFLQKQGASFPNFLLETPPAEWQTKLKADGPPQIFVFNRDNRIVKRWPVNDAKGEPVEEVDFKVIEKLVVELLKK